MKLQLTHYRDVCVERETKDTFRDKSFVVKDPNNCFLFSCSPTNWFAAATRSIESVLSLSNSTAVLGKQTYKAN